MLERINEAAAYISSHIEDKPEIAIILGTGLSGLTREISVRRVLPYSDIPNFPVSTVEGHAGELIFGTLSGKDVMAMSGRLHFYEGYGLDKMVFPVRVMKKLGVKLLVVSNASGGLNPDFAVGDIMFINDHINMMNLMTENPLKGVHHQEFGDRFPDMSCPYDASILKKAFNAADRLGIKYQKGVYVSVTGATFETPAEYRYMRFTGGDAVGMSTVPEVIVANQMGIKVLAISVISDLGVEGKIVKISHSDVIDAASHAEPKMTRIIKELFKEL
jgi:purine-nucleoside phosphorylase